ARVWVPDAEAVWASAQLLQGYRPGEIELFLQLSDGREVRYPVTGPGALPPLGNPEIQDGESDLTALSHLHEPAVLHNLRLRFLDYSCIYTYCGIVLVAINPYEQLPIYGEEVIDAYSGQDTADMDPHIFSVAEEAYRQMAREERNQSIIISGESGAGKTVSAKFAMRYFAVVGGSARQTSVEERVLATNPIMEAFGNAKTTRNDNSSRFGKYIEIGFGCQGDIIGAHMRTYLLEKSRVVFQAPEERNYHIFYQLCTSWDLPELCALRLAPAEQFRYTRQGGGAQTPGTADGADLERTRRALAVLGVQADQQMELFRILAALLHLGNIEIRASSRDGERSSINVDDVALAVFVKMLGVERSQMAHWLCHRRLVVAGETLVKPMPWQQACEARDALAKHVYGQLFSWVVRRLNAALQAPRRTPKSFIGVLDIYGFEMFERNSFEQFCINYANEKLQQQFTQRVFQLEQEEYVREGIPWSRVEFSDNQPCIALIEGPLGVLDLLDEECRMPKGSDETWARKLYEQHQNQNPNPHFGKPRMSDTAFVILHFADRVQYECEGFLDKNRDTVFEEPINILKASQSELVAELFQEEPAEGALTLPGLKSVLPNGSLRAGRRSGLSTIREYKQTVGFQFRQSLRLLMDTLNSTTPHYVRCIKPNDLKQPFLFDPKRAVQQLRACGVLETIRISAAGYPSRQVRNTVVEKFKAGFGYKKISQASNIPRSTVQAIILKWKEYQTTANLPRPGRPSKLSAQTRRRLIRDAAKRPMITLDELQRTTAEVGDIMVWACFSSAGTGKMVKIEGKMDAAKYRTILDENLLESAKDLKLGRRFIFQQDNDPKHTAKSTKEWFTNKRIQVFEWPSQSPDLNPIENLWKELKTAVHKRSPSNLTELELLAQLLRVSRAVLLIQRTFRMVQVRRLYLQLRSAAVTIQAAVRGALARRAYRQLVAHCAATVLQARVRGWLARRGFLRMRQAVLCLQCCYRQLCARRELRRRRAAARSVERYRELHKGMEVKLIQLQRRADEQARESTLLREALGSERAAHRAELARLQGALERLQEQGQGRSALARLQEQRRQEEEEQRRKAAERDTQEIARLTQEVQALREEKAALEAEREALCTRVLAQESSLEERVAQQVAQSSSSLHAELEEERRRYQGLLREFGRLEQRYDNLREEVMLAEAAWSAVLQFKNLDGELFSIGGYRLYSLLLASHVGLGTPLRRARNCVTPATVVQMAVGFVPQCENKCQMSVREHVTVGQCLFSDKAEFSVEPPGGEVGCSRSSVQTGVDLVLFCAMQRSRGHRRTDSSQSLVLGFIPPVSPGVEEADRRISVTSPPPEGRAWVLGAPWVGVGESEQVVCKCVCEYVGVGVCVKSYESHECDRVSECVCGSGSVCECVACQRHTDTHPLTVRHQDSLMEAVGVAKDGAERMRGEDLRHAYDAVRVANKILESQLLSQRSQWEGEISALRQQAQGPRQEGGVSDLALSPLIDTPLPPPVQEQLAALVSDNMDLMEQVEAAEQECRRLRRELRDLRDTLTLINTGLAPSLSLSVSLSLCVQSVTVSITLYHSHSGSITLYTTLSLCLTLSHSVSHSLSLCLTLCTTLSLCLTLCTTLSVSHSVYFSLSVSHSVYPLSVSHSLSVSLCAPLSLCVSLCLTLCPLFSDPRSATPTGKEGSAAQHKGEPSLGLLECKKKDEAQLLRTVVTDLRPDTALSLPPGLPACLLFLCIRHLDWAGEEARVRSLCGAVVSAIKGALKKHSANLDMTALWLRNSFLLTDLLTQHSTPQASEQLDSVEETPQLTFDLSGTRQALSNLSIQAYHQLLGITESRLQPLIVPAMLESETIPGLSSSAGKAGGSRKRASGASKGGPGMAAVLQELGALDAAMAHQALCPQLRRQAFQQLSHLLAATALNSLLLRRDVCSWSRGLQIRYNISQLEEWLRSRSLQTGGTMDSLEPLIQAAQLLQVSKKSEEDARAIVETCTALSSQQIVKILSLYTPHSEFEERVTLNFIRTVQALLTERAGRGPRQLLLDVRRVFPVTFPYVPPPPLRAEQLDIPTCLGLAFLRRV
ncbi:MYO5B protein, partial [Atractosteus spatula]|nr:MYO5B protein [Atractosteus spatula]